MYQSLLRDSSFFTLLLRFDEDLAGAARGAGCTCGGVLHSARYRRKPRGGPAELGEEHAMRWSFCCAREGCRRRLTPPSVRFLGRKVYFAVLVLLLPVLREGPTPERLRRLEALFTVSRRTLLRWRRWWQETVAASRFFEALRGRWPRPVAAAALPGSLVAAFSAIPLASDRVLAVLRCLLPVTGGAGRCGHAV